MPAPTTCEDFLELLRKSNLLEAGALDKQLRLLQAQRPLPATAELVADEMVRAGLLTPFHRENLLKGRFKGFFVGRYRLLEVLGAGGMGHVYLAEHTVMRRLVALKVLAIRANADPVIVLRFQREARAAAVLDHPNIVHAYDADQDEKVHFLVLEYVDGSSLQELIRRRGPLSPDRAANYISQASVGLQHAHEAGIVHRDIKPGNILLDRTGVVKILDMGLAKIFRDHKDNLTLEHNAGSALGSADYLAPEQATHSHRVDTRADIYSLGGTLYFLLTGQAPFHHGSTAEKMLWHQFRAPRPIRALRPEVPVELELVVQKMMAKHPEQRYATATAVAEALRPWAGAITPPPEADFPVRCAAVRNLLQPQPIQDARRAAAAVAATPDVVAPASRAAFSGPALPAQTGAASSTHASATLPRTGPAPSQPATSGSRGGVSRSRGIDLSETPATEFNTETERTDRSTHTPPVGSEPMVESWLLDLVCPPEKPKPHDRRWLWALVAASVILVSGVAGVLWTLVLRAPPIAASPADKVPRSPGP